MFGKVLYDFTRAVASGITFARVALSKILPGLYISNHSPSTPNTPLIYDGDAPMLLPQAYEMNLDKLADAFSITRNVQEGDEDFRRRILFSIGQNSTEEGITRSIERLFEFYNFPVEVDLVPTIRDVFDGTSTDLDAPIRDDKGTLLYGVTVIIRVPPHDGADVVYDDDGEIMYYRVRMVDFVTGVIQEKIYPVNASWDRTTNIYVDRMLASFRKNSMRSLIQDLAAAGINIERVIIETTAAGGAKGLT